MEVLEFIVYAAGLLLTFIWLIGIRMHISSGRGIMMSSVNATMLFIVSLILIPTLELSAMHLLWMFPVSIILGLLSLAPPFSFLSIFGAIVKHIACIGLEHE